MMRNLEVIDEYEENQENSLIQEQNVTPFRKKCIKVHMSRKLDGIMHWVSLINIVPILGEYLFFFTKYRSQSENIYIGTGIIVFEAINGVLTLFYIFEAIIKVSDTHLYVFFISP